MENILLKEYRFLGTVQEFLKRDENLSRLTKGIYTFVPSESVFPYVTLHLEGIAGYNGLPEGQARVILLLSLTIWSSYSGFKEAFMITSACRSLLDTCTLELRTTLLEDRRKALATFRLASNQISNLKAPSAKQATTFTRETYKEGEFQKAFLSYEVLIRF